MDYKFHVVMKRYILHLMVVTVYCFSSCESKTPEPIVWDVVIREVIPLYMAEGGKITLKGHGFTMLESENKVFVNGMPAQFKIVDAETLEVSVPQGTFGDDTFVARVVLENHRGNADTAEFYYDKYPRFYELNPKRAFVGETIAIEGDYLDTNTSDTDVLFLSGNSSLLQGEIVKIDNYTIETKVPDGAVSGTVWYKTQLGDLPENLVLLALDSLTVKK